MSGESGFDRSAERTLPFINNTMARDAPHIGHERPVSRFTMQTCGNRRPLNSIGAPGALSTFASRAAIAIAPSMPTVMPSDESEERLRLSKPLDLDVAELIDDDHLT